MTFVSPNKNIKAVHRFDPEGPELRGWVLSCFPLGEDIYAITIENAWDMVITITTQEWNVSLS
jgi:hypothetical protein